MKRERRKTDIPLTCYMEQLIFTCILLLLGLMGYPMSASASIFQADIVSPNRLSGVRTRSRVSLNSYDGNPKINFLFLAVRDLHLDVLWGTFFENADAAEMGRIKHGRSGEVVGSRCSGRPGESKICPAFRQVSEGFPKELCGQVDGGLLDS